MNEEISATLIYKVIMLNELHKIVLLQAARSLVTK
jgi:hypothetical protein